MTREGEEGVLSELPAQEEDWERDENEYLDWVLRGRFSYSGSRLGCQHYDEADMGKDGETIVGLVPIHLQLANQARVTPIG